VSTSRMHKILKQIKQTFEIVKQNHTCTSFITINPIPVGICNGKIHQ
jgi:hypothetical protein